MTRTSYQSIDLKSPARIWTGRHKTSSVEAVNGTTITRIQDGVLDFFTIAGPSVLDGIEIPVSNIAACTRKLGDVATMGRGGKAAKLPKADGDG